MSSGDCRGIIITGTASRPPRRTRRPAARDAAAAAAQQFNANTPDLQAEGRPKNSRDETVVTRVSVGATDDASYAHARVLAGEINAHAAAININLGRG
jgi:hypothetical protein